MADMTDKFVELVSILSKNDEYMTSEQIADRMDCSSRSVLRYIKRLREKFSDYDIIESSGRGYRLKGSFHFIESILASEDTFAIATINASPLGPLLRSRKSKTAPTFSNDINSLIDLKGKISDDHFRSIFFALKNGEFLEITYRSKDEDKTHLCVPIKIHFDYSLMYLTVFDNDYGHMILLGASKIKAVRKAHKTLPKKKLEEYRNYVRSAWGKMHRHDINKIGTAEFQVDDTIIEYFKKNPLHSSQKITELSNQRYKITMQIHNPLEFVRYVARFGDHLTLTGDEEVLTQAHEFFSCMARKYGSE